MSLKWYFGPHDNIPAFRSIGRRNPRLLFNRDKRELPRLELTDYNFPVHERPHVVHVLESTPALYSYAYGHILADGVKMMKIDPELWGHFSEIALPVAVKDIALPFPALVVESESSYYYVVKGNEVVIGTFRKGQSRDEGVNFMMFLDDNELIENCFGNQCTLLNSDCVPIFNALYQPNGVKTVLNYLAMSCLYGCQHLGRESAHKKQRHEKKIGNPDVYEPQNIELFRATAKAAVNPEASGAAKRPHWRRAHFRHVAKGRGRNERTLRLIPSVFVNQDHFGQDLSETKYTAS